MGRNKNKVSDGELKEEIDRITSRIDAIIRTVSRYYPDSDPSAEERAKRQNAGTE
jgi:hypothetical protein